jgi:hypothetical protein
MTRSKVCSMNGPIWFIPHRALSAHQDQQSLRFRHFTGLLDLTDIHFETDTRRRDLLAFICSHRPAESFTASREVRINQLAHILAKALGEQPGIALFTRRFLESRCSGE